MKRYFFLFRVCNCSLRFVGKLYRLYYLWSLIRLTFIYLAIWYSSTCIQFCTTWTCIIFILQGYENRINQFQIENFSYFKWFWFIIKPFRLSFSNSINEYKSKTCNLNMDEYAESYKSVMFGNDNRCIIWIHDKILFGGGILSLISWHKIYWRVKCRGNINVFSYNKWAWMRDWNVFHIKWIEIVEC